MPSALATILGVLAILSLMAWPDRSVKSAQPEVTFFDDFSGSELDRSNWGVIVTGRTVNNEQQAYVDSTRTIYLATGDAAAGATNGALVLHPRYSPGFVTPEGRKFDFISGRLEGRGKVEFAYGLVAARIKMTAGPGLWPAFWILGTGRWPETGELDVMENVGDPSWTSVALHGPGYSGNTPLVRRHAFPPGSDITGWHVYAMDWRREHVVFTIDGEEIYRATRAAVEQYGRWAYDNPMFLILNVALGGNYPQSVNHAASPYPGLPQETVDLIKADRATMLVDWVGVTKN